MSSASTAGAIKDLIESSQGSLGLTVYRDRVPAGASKPYVTVTEMISYVPTRSDAAFDHGVPNNFAEEAQVSLWQTWRNIGQGASALSEDSTLARKVIALLHGKRLKVGNTINGNQVLGLKVTNAVRLPEEDENIVQVAITVRVIQELS